MSGTRLSVLRAPSLGAAAIPAILTPFARSFTLSVGLSVCLSAALCAQGLPPVPVPPGNPITPAKAVLGKILFWEEQMSSDNRVACGTCHLPEFGGGDARRVVHPGADGVRPSPDDTFGSPGVVRSAATNDYTPDPLFDLNAQVTPRTAPTALAAAWFPSMFWDGRATPVFTDPQTGQVSLATGGALESQAVGPVLSSVEMAHDLRAWGEVAAKLQTAHPLALATNVPPDMAAAIAANQDYPSLFTAAFGDAAITAERIGMAIATYERTLVADQTPWDRAQRGVPGALTAAQQRGLNVFSGPGRCVLCHTPPLFSDGQFRNLGLRPIAQDNGRQGVTGNPADGGKFKVPSLRNAGLRQSFMHTGQFTSIPQVFGFYLGGGGPNLQNKDPLLLPLAVPPQAAQDLIEFVTNGLTDPRVAARQFPFDRPTLGSERIPPLGFLFGLGTPGTANLVPQMLAGVPANIGNVDFKIGVGAARGGAPAALVVSLTRAPIGTQFQGINVNVGVPELIDLFMVLQGTAGLAGAGFGTVRVPLPDDPALIGGVLFAQWFVADPAVPGGASSSRGAEIRFE